MSVDCRHFLSALENKNQEDIRQEDVVSTRTLDPRRSDINSWYSRACRATTPLNRGGGPGYRQRGGGRRGCALGASISSRTRSSSWWCGFNRPLKSSPSAGYFGVNGGGRGHGGAWCLPCHASHNPKPECDLKHLHQYQHQF